MRGKNISIQMNFISYFSNPYIFIAYYLFFTLIVFIFANKRLRPMSPKFKEEKGYVFKIYSNEEERKHIHVIKAENEAKFWLEPAIELANNHGFSDKDIRNITQIILKYGDEFKRKFTEHIGKRLDD